MSAELKIIGPAVLSEAERNELDANIDSLIAAHKNNRQEINRLVFESVAAMTAGEDYERQLANKKGLRRFLGGITGSNKKLQDKINSSRAAAQYVSQQTLQRLAEQNLMSFDLITAVNNKLNASIVAVESEINQIYGALATFFKQSRSDMIQLENRVAKLERNVNLLNWQASIEYQMFGETEYTDLDDTAKVVCLVRDFYDISQGKWTTSDLLLLKAAMAEIGIAPKSTMNYFSFIRELHEREELRTKLLNGQDIATLPSPDYLPVLCGLKKLELFESEENYVVGTAVSLLSSHRVNVDVEQISNDLTVNFLMQEGSVNINSEVEYFSLILELLFSLRQAQSEGILLKETDDAVDVEAPTNDTVLNEENLSPKQLYELGKQYEEGDGVEKDPSEAVRCYQAAAAQGYPAAQYALGNCHFNGYGAAENKETAVEWYTKAAEQGYITSQFALAECYETGAGVNKNKTLAIMWYTKAAEQGHAEAQWRLAVYYINQDNKAKDESKRKQFAEKGEEWLTKAAKQGHPEAQYQMGLKKFPFRDFGRMFSSVEDEKAACRWYKKAAEQGHIGAQYYLGRCYEEGIGIKENITKAKEWYRKAACAGNKAAEERLKDLL